MTRSGVSTHSSAGDASGRPPCLPLAFLDAVALAALAVGPAVGRVPGMPTTTNASLALGETGAAGILAGGHDLEMRRVEARSRPTPCRVDVVDVVTRWDRTVEMLHHQTMEVAATSLLSVALCCPTPRPDPATVAVSTSRPSGRDGEPGKQFRSVHLCNVASNGAGSWR